MGEFAGGPLYGYVRRSSVRSWIEQNQDALRDMPAFLITRIDSERNVAMLPSVLGRWGSSGDVGGEQALQVSGEELLAILADDNFFTGFDEVWILDENADLSGWCLTPGELVCPTELIERPDALLDAMEKSGVIGGVGDGDGLNYVAVDGRLPLVFG